MNHSDVVARCSYPSNLPVSARAEEIIQTIKTSQVTIVAGHTGSGKTTQLPKMCVQAGYGQKGQIAHTQPRRLAAVTVAERIAEELQSPLGEIVGYQIRFDKQYAKSVIIKLQTDGVLLNEIQADPLLSHYDCLIIDEAHERSLNIDFLLGYLKRLLPRRPELRLVITSATIDTERFSRFFSEAPIIEVTGQTFPIETRYRPFDRTIRSLANAVHQAVEEIESLSAEGDAADPNQDILCFLSTEQEITDAARFLRGKLQGRFDVLPLYARLAAKQQRKVFRMEKDAPRRLILATNIAETSLTVPRIAYVIDGGDSRISRYSFHSKIQQLPVEAISRASANQRQGRCGRLGPGLCIRLYSEQDFQERDEFTEPEILRTNLASVVLKLYAMGINDIHSFEFLDAPDDKLLRDGVRLLEEIQALRSGNTRSSHSRRASMLSKTGLTLARLPLEPRIGRLMIAGREFACLSEMLVLCAALSTVDPRERPQSKQDDADKSHNRFTDRRSDFVTLLKLWRYLQQKRKSLSSGAFHKILRREFFSPQRTNDWIDVHRQLLAIATDFGFELNKRPASYQAIHKALLTGFITNVGIQGEKGAYRSTRQRQFRIFPGSGLARSKAPFVLCAEIVETRAVYGRLVAEVKPQWAAAIARHLVQRDCKDPYFDLESGTVRALETTILQGLVLTDRRPVAFARIDPSAAHEVFVEQALVQRQWQSSLPCFTYNAELISNCETISARLRQPELLCIDDALAELFSSVPDEVASVREFEKWYASLDQHSAHALNLEAGACLVSMPSAEQLSQFPDVIDAMGKQFAVRYHFCPGEALDGVEVLVPQALMRILPNYSFDDLVPGLLAEKCIAALKTLPKVKRKPLVPIADAVEKHLAHIASGDGPLLHRLQRCMLQHYHVTIEEDDWQLERLPDYLFVTVSALDPTNAVVYSQRWRSDANITISSMGIDSSKESSEAQPATVESQAYFQIHPYDLVDVTGLTYPSLPPKYEYEAAGLNYSAFPGLILSNAKVLSCLFYEQKAAERSSAWALAYLFQHSDAALLRHYRGQFLKSNQQKLALSMMPNTEHLRNQLLQRMYYQAFDCEFHRPHNAEEYKLALSKGRQRLANQFAEWSALFDEMISAHYAVVRAMQSVSSTHFQPALEDVKQQLNGLLCEEFLAWVPTDSLRHYPRYLKAIAERLQRLREQQGRDLERQQKVSRWQQQLDADNAGDRQLQPYLRQAFFWLLQEYRVSLFAQRLGTAQPVSETRLRTAWEGRFDH